MPMTASSPPIYGCKACARSTKSASPSSWGADMSVSDALSTPPRADEGIDVPLGTDFPEIRAAIRAICRKFRDAYWRDLEDRYEYAEEFVAELGKAAYLGAASQH